MYIFNEFLNLLDLFFICIESIIIIENFLFFKKILIYIYIYIIFIQYNSFQNFIKNVITIL